MTDIQSNMSINAHYNNNLSDSKKSAGKENAHTEKSSGKNDVDLNKTPAAAIGRSMVSHEYKYDPARTEADTKQFMFDFMLAEEFARDLVAEGCSPERASEIAAQMLWLSCENQNA
ncbi:MAG: hypothetical protein LUE64_06785 [Candidatus Gastranaerophilales bacterium]|nr:hypothetical protein [Candidatus Gastranaerophilales bacterium]